jgi:bidirectional [NiFe] hydrogenase diaphorase subunit
VLHTAQNTYGYLTPEVMWYVARQLRLPPSRVYGVATFYNFFSLKPPGEHACVVCEGTACYIRGAARIASAVGEAFGVEPGKTSADGKVSLGIARCLGSCGLAPVLVIDGQLLARQTAESAVESLYAVLAPARQPEPAGRRAS